jgi:hypothetical protein
VEASMSLFGQHHQFNQLFNFVNYVDQIELEPFSIKKVIIAFLPDENKDAKDFVQSGDQFLLEEETFDYNEINGVVFFVCYKDVKKMGLAKQTVSHALPTVEKSVSVKPRSDSKLVEPSDASSAQAVPPDFQVFSSILCIDYKQV